MIRVARVSGASRSKLVRARGTASSDGCLLVPHSLKNGLMDLDSPLKKTFSKHSSPNPKIYTSVHSLQKMYLCITKVLNPRNKITKQKVLRFGKSSNSKKTLQK